METDKKKCPRCGLGFDTDGDGNCVVCAHKSDMELRIWSEGDHIVKRRLYQWLGLMAIADYDQVLEAMDKRSRFWESKEASYIITNNEGRTIRAGFRCVRRVLDKIRARGLVSSVSEIFGAVDEDSLEGMLIRSNQQLLSCLDTARDTIKRVEIENERLREKVEEIENPPTE